jgi:hypothetical protein
VIPISFGPTITKRDRNRRRFSRNYFQITTLQSFLVVRKGFPLFDRLNAAILRITESGLMSRWIYESQVGIDKMSMSNVETHKSRSIDLQRVFSAVVILALGLSASGLAFVAEVLWKWLHKKINE